MALNRLQRIRPAVTIDTVVIGAGQAGLSASYLLSEQGVQHVVLERGTVANSWRQQRWDSLKLLTPNWQTRLPGFRYDGDDPDGYMGMDELVKLMQKYATESRAPIRTRTTVESVQRHDDGYFVITNNGSWDARSVIIASGACNTPVVPAISTQLPPQVRQLTPFDYKNPASVAAGGVLIVGASATGMQLADELLQAGHEVSMAVGEHVRMPRDYRGKDILYWMDRCGILGQRYDEVEDIARGRRLPSSQLIGRSGQRLLDLNSLTSRGAKICGRLVGINNGVAQFSGSLRNVCAMADLKMNRLLSAIDAAIGDDPRLTPVERFPATDVPPQPQLALNLAASGIQTVIWATGFRPDYSWLNVPVLDRKGYLNHDGGIVSSPGLYALGLPLMRRRKSSFIFGIEDDAREITNHLIDYLYSTSRKNSNGIYQNDPRRTCKRRCA